ncbi:radical SAM protein [Pseudobacteroides cellulosolvens]|uniref:Heme chaperone HemW n=1 Tax=Pseudobacteroides cellulosolvens ATCC 35603 = DSM 2933 TaxID=398512 RepID=A0A0L6JV48_9FIRM|nr:NUDIX domain-containing protein [Pseudobacteroides cellulosolvens]KNY29609.1 NUDIX hydrolase [Pseudobacteroides cellulosolvens ATCC 35603 = DSM 2933]
MEPKQTYETGLLYHHYANTAYPLTPKSFMQYRINDQSQIQNFLSSEWAKTDELSLYVHIPFCKVRCKFCEYVVLEDVGTCTEDLYVSLLLKEIQMYKAILKDKKIVGYDIGGGTPTKLSVENLIRITDAVTNSFNIQDNVVFSIETTPIIAAKEPEKILAAYNMGYKRISMGVQTVSEKLLNELGREGTVHIYEEATQNIRKAGFKQFNIDLMYGFLHQSNEEFETTIRYAISLNPEYITLYRNRYKGTKLEKEAEGVSLYKIICQYRLAYKLLLENGYMANAGKNTFSKVQDDYGTSDYLTKRVIYGTPYVGMGLGAQSFGMDYLAYNEGAASKQLHKYQEKIENNQFPIQDIYSLPMEESIAKMVSVAFYFGFVDSEAFSQRLGISFWEHFENEVEFVIQKGLMEIKGTRLYLTERGADYINGIIPLFYSGRSKLELSELFNKSAKRSVGEEEFLKAYKIENYERPSLAADIVVFSLNGDVKDFGKLPPKQLSVLMIRRGEHPYMSEWALPGGFVKPGESAEQAAYRELKEETGLSDVTMSQLHLFSEPKRDPRGWIVSCSFIALAYRKNFPLQFGEDAIDAQWFEVQYDKLNSSTEENKVIDIYDLVLSNEVIALTARVEAVTAVSQLGRNIECHIVESNGIAFDHAKILAHAINRIQEFI